MKTGPPKVITLESDSEDELQIVSENIQNYGNFSTPVEIAPEIQEKIRISLEKNGSLPGKIKTIKVYSTKRNKEIGSVRASVQSSNGQPSQTINVGPSINALLSNAVFSNRVKGGGNNNSRKENPATASEKLDQVRRSPQISLKRSHRPSPDAANTRITQCPSEPSSPVILYSPVRKRKTPKSRDNSGGAFTSHGFQQTFTHPLIDEENGFQESSRNKRETNVEFKMNSNFPKITQLKTSDLFKNVWAGVNSNTNPVNLSPMRVSSDDENFVDDSILAIWDSPVQPPRSAVDPPQNLEDVPILLENNTKFTKDVIDSTKDLVSEIGEELKGCNLISEQYNVFEKESKITTENGYNFASQANQIKPRDKGEQNLESETEKIIRDVNSNRQCDSFESKKQKYSDSTPKSVKINTKILSKRLFKSSEDKRGNDEESFLKTSASQDKNPPPWTTMFPPSPPPPPPPRWMNSAALYDLNTADFLAVTGLCRLETAKEVRKNLNAPKPLVRVLRRRKK